MNNLGEPGLNGLESQVSTCACSYNRIFLVPRWDKEAGPGVGLGALEGACATPPIPQPASCYPVLPHRHTAGRPELAVWLF